MDTLDRLHALINLKRGAPVAELRMKYGVDALAEIRHLSEDPIVGDALPIDRVNEIIDRRLFSDPSQPSCAQYKSVFDK